MKTFFKFLIKTIIFFTLLIVPSVFVVQLGVYYDLIRYSIYLVLCIWIARGIFKLQQDKPPTTKELINMLKKPFIFFGLLVIGFYLGNDQDTVLISALLFCGLIMWLIRGLWRSYFNPPSQESWRFLASHSGPREKWLKEEIRNLKFKRNKYHKSNKLRKEKKVKAKIEKYNNDLDLISKKFSEEIKDYQIKEEVQREYNKALGEVSKEYDTIGVHSPKVICPHCSEKGNVWRNDNATREEKSQEAGVIGAVIGKKTITKKQVTQMHCKNCSTSWVV